MQTSKIKSVKKVDYTGRVYDVVMKKNPHTFFANDILVHNSCYFRIMDAANIEEAKKIGENVVKACDEGSIPGLVQNVFNGYDCMRSDFEAISSSTLSYGKKKQYAFLKAWEDGEVLPTPKLSITGLSIKRSDSPKQLSREMKPFFIKIMKGLPHDTIKEIMDDIERDYSKLSLYDLAAKRSSNNLSKYLRAFNYEITNKIKPFDIDKFDELVAEKYTEENEKRIKIPMELYDSFMQSGKGVYSVEDGELRNDKNGDLVVNVSRRMVIPFHVKASILYNFLLDSKGIRDFNPILEGDKIKLFYITPQKFKIKATDDEGTEHDMIQEFDCIAFPSSSKKIPPFISEFTPDKTKMLETYFFGKMETIFGVIGFNKERMANQSMDMLF